MVLESLVTVHEDYSSGKRNTFMQCAFLGLSLGFISRMTYNQQKAMGSLWLPALITVNNRQKDWKSYIKNIGIYEAGYIAGFAAYSIIEYLAINYT
ncbi:hypothetical protein J4231_03765 [Candidatus Woesearchaeota archaeon]|nr:hypothetical protein [Candidatus Woesearchaeota archaeon]